MCSKAKDGMVAWCVLRTLKKPAYVERNEEIVGENQRVKLGLIKQTKKKSVFCPQQSRYKMPFPTKFSKYS